MQHITNEFLALLEQGLRHLSDASPDGVQYQNDVGFNARDLAIGTSLLNTGATNWTAGQLDAAWKVVNTYRNTQLSHLAIPQYVEQVDVNTAYFAARTAARADALAQVPGWGLKWSAPRTVNTKLGARIVTAAILADKDEFWTLWRKDKEALKAQGYSVGQYQGRWQVTKWEVPATSTPAPAVVAPTPYVVQPLINTAGLLPYQIPSVERLVASLRVYTAALDSSDVGTGKTYAALAACRELGLSPVVVAPKSVLPSWRKAAVSLGVTLAGVINYELVRLGKTEFGSIGGTEKTPTFDWAPTVKCLIFDEVHRCKGTKTANHRLVVGAKRAGIPTLALSATAAVNPLELKALGYLLGLHNLKGFWAWTEDYGCRPSRWGGYEFTGSASHLARLHAEIFPRRGSRVRVSDLGDAFPETQVTSELVQVGNAAAVDKAYAEVEAAIEAVREKGIKDAEHHLTKLLRARQVSELGKIPAFVDIAEDGLEQGLSVALFVNFDDTLRTLVDTLTKSGHTVVQIHGQQTAEERQAAIEAFQADTARVIVANIQAGGVGVSLHDLNGNHPRLALVSPTWSAVNLRQALGRVHRAGGKSKSRQRILFAAGTVEERVARLVEEKLTNLDALNDGDVSPVKF